jgi:hypothetical protein
MTMDTALARSLLMLSFGLGLIMLGLLLDPLTLLDRLTHPRRTS